MSRGVLSGIVVVAGACATPSGDPVRVTVPPGAVVSHVADSLAARGIIRSPRMFRLYTKLSGTERALQAGVYELRPGSSLRAVVRALAEGQTALDRFVIPEGFMLAEIAPAAEMQLGIPAESLLAAARDSALRARVGARGPTLEGYLYPDTYYVRIGARADELVLQMVEEFESRWDTGWDRRLAALGLSRDEALTLASIIEGEVRDPTDRAYVSSVYHNRLNRGMRLEADPTVIYALGERRRLLQRDYRTRSPYNTYLIDGLPPHPIGQPSVESIEAALYPASSDFLFFVAGPGGKHVFTRSYREHLAAIRRIRSGSGGR